MKIFGELLPLIDTINIYANDEQSDEFKEILVEDNIICLKSSSTVHSFKLCGNVKLKPYSVSGINYEQTWLCFRLRLEHSTRIINSVLNEIMGEMSCLKINDYGINKLQNCEIQFQCKCSYPLSNSVTFVKFRPLPNLDWDLTSESWFCHLSEKHKNSVKNYDLVPKENECFYNDLLFAFHPSALAVNVVNGILQCKSCSREVGFLKGKIYNLWTHDFLCIKNNETLFSKSANDIIFNLFYSLSKENIGASLQLLFEFKSQNPKFIYILVMDNNLSLYVTENSNLYDLKPNISETLRKKQKLEDSNVNFLRKINSIKVLYKIKSKADEESGLWFDNINVNVIRCGIQLFDSLVNILEHSNECIPNSLRIVDDLKVGYFVDI